MASIGLGGVAAILGQEQQNEQRRLEGRSDGAIAQLLGGIQTGASMDRAEREVSIHEAQEQRSKRKFEDNLIAQLAESNLLNLEEEAKAENRADFDAELAEAQAANQVSKAESDLEFAQGVQSATDDAERRKNLEPYVEQMRELFGDEWADGAIDAYIPQTAVEEGGIRTPARNFVPNAIVEQNAESGFGGRDADGNVVAMGRGSVEEMFDGISTDRVPLPVFSEEDLVIDRHEAAERLAALARKNGLNPDLATVGMALAQTDLTMAARRSAERMRQKEQATAQAAASKAAAEQQKWAYTNKLNDAKANTQPSVARLNDAKAKRELSLVHKHEAETKKLLRRPVRRAPGESWVKATDKVMSDFAVGKIPPVLNSAMRRFVTTMKGEKKRVQSYTKNLEGIANAASFLRGEQVDQATEAEFKSSFDTAVKALDNISPSSANKLIGMHLIGISEDQVANHMAAVAMARVRTGGKIPGDVFIEVEREFNAELAKYGKAARARVAGGKPVEIPAIFRGPGTIHEARKLDAQRGVVTDQNEKVQAAVREGTGPTNSDFKRSAQGLSEAFMAARSAASHEDAAKLDSTMADLKVKIGAFMGADLPAEDRAAKMMQLHSEMLAATREFAASSTK